MARRRDLGVNDKLTEAELEEFRIKVEGLSRAQLETEYKVLHNRCRYEHMRVPSPQIVQEFVQVWRRLRKLKGDARLWP